MTVTPPSGWGKIAGERLTGTDCKGNTRLRLGGAQVQANGKGYTFLAEDRPWRYVRLLGSVGEATRTPLIASKGRFRVAGSETHYQSLAKTVTANFAAPRGRLLERTASPNGVARSALLRERATP